MEVFPTRMIPRKIGFREAYLTSKAAVLLSIPPVSNLCLRRRVADPLNSMVLFVPKFYSFLHLHFFFKHIIALIQQQ